MKKITIFLTAISLLLLISGTGCKKEKETDCYKGTIISLNDGNACNDIVRIDAAPKNGIPIGTTLAFYSGLFDRKLKIGETIYFKVLRYKKWVGPANASCLWPYYTATIEVCNH